MWIFLTMYHPLLELDLVCVDFLIICNIYPSNLGPLLLQFSVRSKAWSGVRLQPHLLQPRLRHARHPLRPRGLRPRPGSSEETRRRSDSRKVRDSATFRNVLRYGNRSHYRR